MIRWSVWQKERNRDDSVIFGLRNLEYEIGFNCDEVAASEAHLGREYEFGLKHVMFDKIKFECRMRLLEPRCSTNFFCYHLTLSSPF